MGLRCFVLALLPLAAGQAGNEPFAVAHCCTSECFQEGSDSNRVELREHMCGGSLVAEL